MSLTRLQKATIIDGCAANEDRDSQNEVLSLEGADISEMVKRGVLNDNHSSGMSNVLGKIVAAKKIFKEEDAEDERQKMYWEKMKRPFLYVKGRLFDESGHENAKAVAAIMREFKKMGQSLEVQMSVEGKVINRGDNGLLKESLIRNVALTLVPANKSTGAQIVSQDVRKAILARCQEEGANMEYADNLMKSLCAVATVSMPGFIEVVDEEEKKNPLDKVFGNIKKINDSIQMLKALTAGYGSAGAPASKVGGNVTMRESGNKDSLKSTTFDALKIKRQGVLKALIKKTKASNLGLSYGEVVKAVLKVFHNKY